MNTRDNQGAFITLIWTLIAKVKEIADAPSGPIHPHADIEADLLLLPVVSRGTQRRLAEDATLNHRAYRFSSVDSATLACWNGRALKFSSR
jgi:hypothetical protein